MNGNQYHPASTIYHIKFHDNSTNLTVTSKLENKIAGCLPDSRGILATMYINNGDKEQGKVF